MYGGLYHDYNVSYVLRMVLYGNDYIDRVVLDSLSGRVYRPGIPHIVAILQAIKNPDSTYKAVRAYALSIMECQETARADKKQYRMVQAADGE